MTDTSEYGSDTRRRIKKGTVGEEKGKEMMRRMISRDSNLAMTRNCCTK
jgi:hypothetical protein